MNRIMKLMAVIMLITMSTLVLNVHANEAPKSEQRPVEQEEEQGIKLEGVYQDVEFAYDVFDYAELISEDATPEQKAEAEVILAEIEALEAKLTQAWDSLDELDVMDWEVYDVFENDMNCEVECYFEPMTVDMISDMLNEDLTAEQLATVEQLVNDINAAEEASDFDKADELWNQLDELGIWLQYEDVDYMDIFTFENFSEGLKEDLSADVLADLEADFNEAIALEEAGDFDGAFGIWDDLFTMDIWNYEMIFEDAVMLD